MKKSLKVVMVTIASLALTIGVVKAATEINITSSLGGETGDTFDLDGTLKVDSIKVGQQDVGGVTFFNGTIINNTTSSGADNPVTFGDNVRIDGRVYRGATAGTGDTMPFIVNDNMEVAGTLDVTGVLTVTDISGTGVIGTDNLDDRSVTPAKISGTGGANLPIAYGYCDSDGTTRSGTSNVSCSWDTSQYRITITGEEYFYNRYITIVTSANKNYIAETNSQGDDLLIDFEDAAGTTGLQTDFAFVVYKP